eukprot:3676652-Alexandrium_andersonii.AAC.1
MCIRDSNRVELRSSELRARLQARSAAAKVLKDSCRVIINMPMCLGKGATGLATKASLVLRALWMMAPPPRRAVPVAAVSQHR